MYDDLQICIKHIRTYICTYYVVCMYLHAYVVVGILKRRIKQGNEGIHHFT